MKNFKTKWLAPSLAGLFTLLLSFVAVSQSTSTLTNDEVRFLREAADARMMDMAEAVTALERSENAEVREYAEFMVMDQKFLLDGLQELASAHDIQLPTAISEDKLDALQKLKEESVGEFDQRFIKMMIIDHKRDVRAFTKATEFSNPDLKAYAQRNLAMVENHLRKAEELKDQITEN